MPATSFLPLMTAAALALSAPGAALAFEKVKSRDQFVQLVQGKDLRLTGIKVKVSPAGQITGRAFGVGVRGEWQWRNGYFCRSLFWGKRDLGPNCQEVQVKGDTIRFTSDKGAGEFADLAIR